MKTISTKIRSKNILAVIFIFFFSFLVKAQLPGDWQFATHAGGSGTDASKGLATDGAGNVYVTGYFNIADTFHGASNIVLQSAGSSDIFLAKFDGTNGNVLWAVRAGGGYTDYGFGITIDALGNIYIAGSFSDTATFYGVSNIQLISNGAADIFIAKYDGNGNVLWAKKAGGSGSEYAYKIKQDGAGNNYITGYFPNDTLIFYGTTNDSLTSNGVNDVFLAKYDQNGNVIWASRAGGAGNDYGYGLAVDNAGNSFVTGTFTGTDSFYTSGPTVIYFPTQGSNDIFVAKFDPLGNALWAKQAGSVFADQGNNIAIDNLCNVYVTGNSNSGCIFYGTPNITLPSNGLQDIFVAKYDSSGNVHWAVHAGGTSGEFSSGICTDGNGHCFITGYYMNTATFYGTSNINITSAGGLDVFAAAFDTAGTALCVQTAGGPGFDRGWDVTTNATGNLFVGGEFSGTSTFPSTPNILVTAAGGTDAFLGLWVSLCTTTTGISSSANETTIKFYPNPTTNVVYINAANEKELSAEIKDITGRIVSKQKLQCTNGITQMQLSLPDGIYFLSVKTDGGKVFTQKLVVSN